MVQRREQMVQRREQIVQRREQMVQRRKHYYVAMATCLETVTRQPTGAGYIHYFCNAYCFFNIQFITKQ